MPAHRQALFVVCHFNLIMHKLQSAYVLLMFTLLLITAMGCKHGQGVQLIKGKEADREGVFLHDTIPTGLIKYYKPGTGELVGVRRFENGIEQGDAINYYMTRMIQKIHFTNGLQEGFDEVYDSTTGQITEKINYWHGKEIGPTYYYNSLGKIDSYEFRDFEGRIIFSASFDSASQDHPYDDFEKLYTATVHEVVQNNQSSLGIFTYLISPPHTRVNYKVSHFDHNDKEIDSFLIPSNQAFFWEGYIKLNSDKDTPAVVITVWDSLQNKSKTYINYLLPKEKDNDR